MSRKAEADIALFVDDVTPFGIQHAERDHDVLERTFPFLAETPDAARERLEIAPPVRIHRSIPTSSSIRSMRTRTCSSSAFGLAVRMGDATSRAGIEVSGWQREF